MSLKEYDPNELSQDVSSLTIHHTKEHPLVKAGSEEISECETAEEAVTTDSEEYLSVPLRFNRVRYSLSSTDSNSTLRAGEEERGDMDDNISFISNTDGIQIPIVGYEVMEERARFTVFKLRVENKSTGDCWYVFRRYTDFVRLCSRLKDYPKVIQHLPRKRYLGNNFEPGFLEERANGLQTLVDSILREPKLLSSAFIQDFFCLNEPPTYSENNEESRAILESLEDTIYQLKQQVREKEMVIENLQDSLHSKTIENENLRKMVSTMKKAIFDEENSNSKTSNKNE